MSTLTDMDHGARRPPWGWLALGFGAWIAAYASLIPLAAAVIALLAFMMSVIALSLPEMVILRKVLKLPLILTFAGVAATGILFVGYVFNAVL